MEQSDLRPTRLSALWPVVQRGFSGWAAIALVSGTTAVACHLVSVTWTTKEGRAVWNGRLLGDWVPDLVDQVVALLDPEAVWLYGSVARGDDDGDPDIDLLVVLPFYDPAAAIELKRRVYGSITVPVPFDVGFHRPSPLRSAGTDPRDPGACSLPRTSARA